MISLLTSSPEPEFVEDYAEDSVDETYDEVKGLPTGAEWVKKNCRPQRSRKGLRGQSLPATTRKTGSVTRW